MKHVRVGEKANPPVPKEWRQKDLSNRRLDGEEEVVDNEIAGGDEVNERLEKSGKSNRGARGCDERERLFSYGPLERDRVLALEGLGWTLSKEK
jgi:hypothetical protein